MGVILYSLIWTFHLKCHMVCLSVLLLYYIITRLWFCNKNFVLRICAMPYGECCQRVKELEAQTSSWTNPTTSLSTRTEEDSLYERKKLQKQPIKEKSTMKYGISQQSGKFALEEQEKFHLQPRRQWEECSTWRPKVDNIQDTAGVVTTSKPAGGKKPSMNELPTSKAQVQQESP